MSMDPADLGPTSEKQAGHLLVNLGFSGLPENQRQFNSYRSLWGIWGLYQNFVHTSNLSGRTVCPESPKSELKNKRNIEIQNCKHFALWESKNPSFSKNKNVKMEPLTISTQWHAYFPVFYSIYNSFLGFFEKPEKTGSLTSA